jgi:hypothetical protein
VLVLLVRATEESYVYFKVYCHTNTNIIIIIVVVVGQRSDPRGAGEQTVANSSIVLWKRAWNVPL